MISLRPPPPAAVQSGGLPVADRRTRIPEVNDSLRLERARAHVASLRRELQAVERALLDDDVLARALSQQRVVYVGGRPASNIALRALVQRAGGEFVHHSALIDDDGRAGGFAALLPGVDRVLCPLDLIDPDSLVALRRLCTRHHVPWSVLRTSSVASFIAGVLRVPPHERRGATAPSRFCLRHG
jgi:hypothetical protein